MAYGLFLRIKEKLNEKEEKRTNEWEVRMDRSIG